MSKQRIHKHKLGKDKYLELCSECPFDDCIRGEGDYSAYRAPDNGVRQYPGCPVWEAGKAAYEAKVRVIYEREVDKVVV